LVAESKPRGSWLGRIGISQDVPPGLRSRIALRVAAALLPLCRAAGVAQYVNTAHNRELLERALVARGEAALAHLSTALQELRILLEAISALPLDGHADGEVCGDAFRRIVLLNKDVSSLHLMGVDGLTLCSAPAMAAGTDRKTARARRRSKISFPMQGRPIFPGRLSMPLWLGSSFPIWYRLPV